ncbi:spore maturation protein CgeB [Clostridium acetobutylicum]|uniref:Ucharacterized protein, CGEB homolog n=1 Tax=Clostridium acetobutylicum (strain ATCC 824 / DSM 792 / JCM 1419 / IAM 19013 / LMG 5710 / NBRC 13948 / NRRL B-527 / VKM B-1787 / 2291 / W) TaxID=272562 RepID=Q97H36_CLOAB|nr:MULTISPECIES: glycosyltransferase [Clostridium]AAK80135.1 Ucharacterized protein, CGEB homolog [Clostridium acetobutylicum ATCC 824]ADZ21228.1 Conserved hypothetical protein [Clostridium acetobutylicum EA 2018]AEI32211.1 hypothetical protein SMB_G2210 [Clostridium acetobutylicum DSM 1731]AWV79440.1 hypothetical protein DK921_04865 [Clostridium acetobutylicum]MBC2394589.1 glycosyltransferase [Clostridium acetobutylicum]
MLKVILTCLKYDYNDKSRGYSFEYENFYKTLIKMDGIELLFFDICDFGDKKKREDNNNNLIKLIEKEKPDILLNILYEDQIKKETFLYIKNNTKTILVNWFCDDQWRFESTSIKWCWCFDYCVTTYKKAIVKYKELGYENIIFSQWACNQYNYFKRDIPFKYDVSFVGQPHSNRREIINKLKQKGIEVACFGYGWNEKDPNSSRISQDSMIDVFNSSKINLNLSNSSHLDAPQQIKGRNFEVPACGAFILTSDVEGLSHYYEIGKEVVVYSSFDDMVDKIKYFLINEEKRRTIANAGYIRTIKEHTYENRLNDIFKIVLKDGKDTNKKMDDLFYRFNYKEKADVLSVIFKNAVGKNIGIYGSGDHTTNLIKYYKKLIGDIKFNTYYFDSNSLKWGTEYLGGIIHSPKEIDELNLDRIIISSYEYEEDIFKYLNEITSGINIVKIYNGDKKENLFTD